MARDPVMPPRKKRLTKGPSTRPQTVPALAKHRRESELLDELQRDHGYMFTRMQREHDSHTMQVNGSKSGKLTMTTARVLRVIVPDESWMAAQGTQGNKHTRKAA